MNHKTVLMLGLTGLVAIMVLMTGMDSTYQEFKLAEQENFSVEEGEWFEKGFVDDELSDTGLEEVDGYLQMEDPSRGDKAVWRSELFVPEVMHETKFIEAYTEDIVLDDRYQTINAQIFCPLQDEVLYEVSFIDGESLNNVDVSPDQRYELRLVFETDRAGETPRIRDMNYEYTTRYLSGFNMRDFAEYVVYFLLAVVVASFLVNAKDSVSESR